MSALRRNLRELATRLRIVAVRRRVADLAAFVQERALGSIWASIGPGAEQALAPSVKAEDIDAERGAADASNPVWFEAPTIASRPPPAR